MPDKERLTRLLSEYGVADRYIDDLCDEIEECYVPELEKARKGLIAVKDLIENSYGVVGLHLNGDPAPWDSLLEGGQFEDWLKDFSEAMALRFVIDICMGEEAKS